MRSLVGAVVVALLLGVAPSAAGQGTPLPEPPNRKSENVTWLASLSEPNVISARFDVARKRMYVSTLKGLAVYDVTDPAAPEQVGFLALPHFENEDVDLSIGGGFALISNDPSEGAGLLYVVSILTDTPVVIGQLPLGTLDTALLPYGTGHTASCVPPDCKYAYLAGTRAGIDVVDLTVPTAPRFAEPRNLPVPEATGGLATHDVQFDRAGRALVTGAGGTAIYDVSDPLAPALVARTDETGQSDYGEDLGADGSTLNDLVHHNSSRLPNSSLLEPPPGAPAAGDSKVMVITEEDYNRPTCAGAGTLQTWGIGDDGLMRNLDAWEVEVDPSRQTLCSAHYFEEDGGLLSQGWYEQGTRFLDVSDPADIRQVGFWIPQKNVTWGAVYAATDPEREIVYALDHPRGIDVIRIERGSGAPLPDPGPPPPGDPDDQPDPIPGRPTPTPTASPAASPTPTPTPAASPAATPVATVAPGVAPPAGGPDLSARVSVTVRDGRSRVRRGGRLRYRVTIRNAGGVPARDVRVQVRMPRALVRLGKRRSRIVTYRTGSLAADASRTFELRARVRRRTTGTRITLRARVTAAQDASRGDDLARDRTTISRRRAGSASAMAARTSAMPTVRAPFVDGGVRQAFLSAYGLCRRLVRSAL